MDVLEQLRSDMVDAGREASEQGENITNACLDILDEFIAGQEVVEVKEHGGDASTPYPHMHWLLFPDSHNYNDSDLKPTYRHTLDIIVPRKRKPDLLAAAEALHVAAGKVATLRAGDIGTEMGAWEELRDADEALAEAIAKEKSNA